MYFWNKISSLVEVKSQYYLLCMKITIKRSHEFWTKETRHIPPTSDIPLCLSCLKWKSTLHWTSASLWPFPHLSCQPSVSSSMSFCFLMSVPTLSFHYAFIDPVIYLPHLLFLHEIWTPPIKFDLQLLGALSQHLLWSTFCYLLWACPSVLPTI
jgi:hypothetical protein